MRQSVDGIVMFSGGLDSIIAAHLLGNLGLTIVALHYVLPFYSGLGNDQKKIRDYTAQLGMTLRIEEEGIEFMEMVKSPHFGFGKNANPCLDCRIHRLVKAKKIMDEYGASFIATGEVVGQRPMSQRLECLHIIEKRAGLAGRLLRPLSAQLLPETIPEKEGLVDRAKLLAISGRGRKAQLQYARDHGLQHEAPAGGCLLTHAVPAQRYKVLAEKFPQFTFQDFTLIAYGRHFLIENESCRLVVARDDRENRIIETFCSDDDLLLETADTPGPLAVLRGALSPAAISTAASFAARYSRLRSAPDVRIRVWRRSGEDTFVTVTPATPSECDECRF